MNWRVLPKYERVVDRWAVRSTGPLGERTKLLSGLLPLPEMSKKPLIVGIAGGSGSGKTTVLRAMALKLGEERVTLFSQDNYYKPIEDQETDANGEVNFDLPTAIDRERFVADLRSLQEGHVVEVAEYDFNSSGADPTVLRIAPRDVIVTEGLFVFCYPEVWEMLDLRLYVDVQEGERLRRRIDRDGKERNYPPDDVRYRWKNHVRPAELKYLEPYRESADFIIDNTSSFEPDLDLAVDRTEALIKKRLQP